MATDEEQNEQTPEDSSDPIEKLPEDVAGWVRSRLQPNEDVAACLLGDIGEDGGFGEHWAFLTNQRVFVLTPNGKPGEAEVGLELPMGEIEDVQIRDYVGSAELVVNDSAHSHPVARFSLGSIMEANDFCRLLDGRIQARAEYGKGKSRFPPIPKRPSHRCPECGAALHQGSDTCLRCIDKRRVLMRLLSYLMPFKWLVLFSLSMTALTTAMQLAPPYLTMILLDDVIMGGRHEMLKVIIIILVGVYVGRAVITAVRSYLMAWLSNRILLNLRVEVYDHLQKLPLSYYNRRQTGEIMSRVTNDLSRLHSFIATSSQDILIQIATVILIAGILLTLNVKLALLTLAPIPIIIVSTGYFSHRIHKLYHRIWRRTARVSAILADTIPGIRVVKSFAQDLRETTRFGDSVLDLFTQELRAARLSCSFFPFMELMTGLGAMLIFGVGGYMAIDHEITAGVLVAFTTYLWRFYMPIQQFGRISDAWQHCVTSAERVFNVLDSEAEPLERRGGKRLDPVRGEVEFRNVRFGYEPGKYALDGISFKVKPGEMIGLVGPSGAGKSTLVHLISRFYDLTEGQVLIDGHSLEDLDLRHLRQQTGVVLQESYLFHGSIWKNIAYSNFDASEDDIIAAARAANAHDFIVRLPDGYDTIIGERGQTVSGGERQRISIARAILTNPRILILDEATASVDTETEVLIQEALERLVHNRTTFAIAHRLSTLRKADRLVVLDNGKLSEIGTHDELLASGGLYRRLVDMQSELSKIQVL